MDWTAEQQSILEGYTKTYLDLVTDISKFYTNIDWNKIAKITNYNDVEVLKIKVDEIFDHSVMDYDLQLSKFVSRWVQKDSQLYTEVSEKINSIKLSPFKEVIEDTAVNEETQGPAIETESRPRANDMPTLTKKQRRLSLELMQHRPKLATRGAKGQLSTTPATSITNLNVMTRSKPVLDRTHTNIANPERRPELRNRRTSLVDEQLPKYIREQLSQGQQPVQTIAPKISVRKLSNLPPIVDTREVSRKSSRLQNVEANSQSLYAHSNDVNSTTTTSDVEHQLQYDTDEDDREYILPGLLAKYYGLQFEEGSDVDYDYDDEEEEEEIDFVNVEGSLSNDENDYLFKV